MSTPAKRKINVQEARAIISKAAHAIRQAHEAAETLEQLKALGPVPELRKEYGDMHADRISNARSILRGALK